MTKKPEEIEVEDDVKWLEKRLDLMDDQLKSLKTATESRSSMQALSNLEAKLEALRETVDKVNTPTQFQTMLEKLTALENKLNTSVQVTPPPVVSGDGKPPEPPKPPEPDTTPTLQKSTVKPPNDEKQRLRYRPI